MRIESLRLMNIGPFDDSTIEFPKAVNDRLADVYLLVGQNGCGKTTAIEAIASLIFPPYEAGSFRSRGASNDSAVVAETSAGRIGALVGPPSEVHSPRIANQTSQLRLRGPIMIGQRFLFYGPPVDRSQAWSGWFSYSEAMRGVGDPRVRFSWAAFCYTGIQPMPHIQVTSISEISESPLNGALSFGASVSAQRLAQWIVLQDYRIGKTSNAQRKDELRRSLELLDTAIAEIIGSSFSFVVPDDRLTPQAKVGNQLLEFDLLPRGLQTIVGWIGDLLMRLDRLPWVDAAPPNEREFLLLLDEIDLHLHPAWQRRLLPVVQRLFPKAQVIASTHSPFVVASLRDGAVIELRLDERGRSTAQPPLNTWERNGSSVPHSYSGVLSRLFGIDSDFDSEEERQIQGIQELARKVMRGEVDKLPQLEAQAKEIQSRADEYLGQLVEFELRQARASLKR